MILRASFHWFVAVTILAAANIAGRAGAEDKAAGGPPELALFPIRSGMWSCIPRNEDRRRYIDPNIEKAWLGQCRKNGEPALDVFIGYAGDSRRGMKILSPALNNRALGDGWSYVGEEPFFLSDERSGNSKINVNLTLLRHNLGDKTALAYWYQNSGTGYASEYQFRFALLMRRVMGKSAASQIVRISLPVGDVADEKALELEKDLAQALAPILLKSFR